MSNVVPKILRVVLGLQKMMMELVLVHLREVLGLQKMMMELVHLRERWDYRR